MHHLRLSVVTLCLALTLLLTASLARATSPDEDVKPIKTGVSISGIVEDDYTDGLLVTTDAGTTYLILTPEEISLETEEAYHKAHKGQRVTMTGDVYKDDDGSLSLYVKTLPQ